jgi:DNA-binding transcriptional ArsR family regulator
MPVRVVATREMAALLGAIAHPHRIRIIEELRNGEMDVNTLQGLLEVSHSRVSQHLSVLRWHHVVVERREGRHVFYRLVNPRLASWLVDGLSFVAEQAGAREDVRDAVEKTREIWQS